MKTAKVISIAEHPDYQPQEILMNNSFEPHEVIHFLRGIKNKIRKELNINSSRKNRFKKAAIDLMNE